MDVARVIVDGFRDGDFLWSLPLVTALGPDGRLASVRWVERCLHRMADLGGFHLRSGDIHERIAWASAAASARDLREVNALTERAGLSGDPVVVAIAMLHVAYWQAAQRGDNQFAVSQESVFWRMRAALSDAEWRQAAELAVEEFRASQAVAPDAEPDGVLSSGHL